MENKADKANLALFSGLINAYTNKPVDTKLIAKKINSHFSAYA